MPRKNRDEDADFQRAAELVAKLHVLVHMTGEPIVGAKFDQNIADVSYSPEELAQLRDAMREVLKADGATDEEAEEALKEAERILADPKSLPPEELQQMRLMAVIDTTFAVVPAWINALTSAVTGAGGAAWIREAHLDDAMLPKDDEHAAAIFDGHFADAPVDAETGRAILRAIRAKLADGRVLPDEMVEFLGCHGVVVIP